MSVKRNFSRAIRGDIRTLIVFFMVTLSSLVAFLEATLSCSTTPDYPMAYNGLQLENSGNVTKIGLAVDASQRILNKAIEEKVDFLLVHHGLFWSGVKPLVGPYYQKIKTAMMYDIAVYSAHLPLDNFSPWGNSRVMAEQLGLADIEPFAPWKGLSLGVIASYGKSCDALCLDLEALLKSPVQRCGQGSDFVEKVAIVSGGSGNDIENFVAQGATTLIVGEGGHWTVPLAEELGVNLIFAGHYATETFGVKAMGAHLAQEFSLPWVFLDAPTGR